MLRHRVAIVVDPEHGDLLRPLAERVHIWAVKSPANEVAVRAVWASMRGDDSDPLKHGATVFNPSGTMPSEWCMNILDAVEEHHGPYSHDPPLSVVEVIGTPLDDDLRSRFIACGYTRFVDQEGGFVAYRERAPSAST